MNDINQIDIIYLTSSRTIETLLIGHTQKSVYVYNYEGYHFRLFLELRELIQFLQLGKEPQLEFSNDEDLDDYLLNTLF